MKKFQIQKIRRSSVDLKTKSYTMPLQVYIGFFLGSFCVILSIICGVYIYRRKKCQNVEGNYYPKNVENLHCLQNYELYKSPKNERYV